MQVYVCKIKYKALKQLEFAIVLFADFGSGIYKLLFIFQYFSLDVIYLISVYYYYFINISSNILNIKILLLLYK